MSVYAVPVFRIVPNGVDDDAGQWLNVTVMVSPMPVGTSTGAIPLEKWPSEMAKWLGNVSFELDLEVEPITKETNRKPSPGRRIAERRCVTADLHRLKAVHAKGTPQHQWDKIDAYWKACFSGIGKDGWDPWTELEKALKLSAQSESFNVNPDDALPVVDAAALDASGALVGQGSGQNKTETVASVLAVSQSFFAATLQRKRGEAVDEKLAMSVPVASADRGLDIAAFRERVKEAGLAPAAPENELDPKKVRLAVLTEVLSQTKTARKNAASRFKTLQEALKNDECVLPTPSDSAAAASGTSTPGETAAAAGPAVDAPKVTASTMESEAVAVQQYGSWAQQQAVEETMEAARSDRAAVACRDAVAQIFFSLQSGPSLARIFGLAFDARIALGDLASLGLPDKGAWYCFIGADGAEAGPSPAAPGAGAVTAARIELSGGRASSFLPATRAELALSPKCKAESRESWLDSQDQRDGLVPMSAAISAIDDGVIPRRFQLTTLDVRRAVDQATQDFDSNRAEPDVDLGGSRMNSNETLVPTLRDKGQRYRTAGFSLADGRRGLGALEELAVLSIEGKASATPTLYAEDLLIGHLLDVRLEGSGPKTWRSLMERYVEFSGLEALDAIVPVLVGAPRSGRRMDLERSQITSPSRLVPQPTSSPDNKRDVVVEEAVAVWDGSPMAVDCGAQSSSTPQTSLADPTSLPVALPFTRILNLPGPGDEEADRRPPPLRYGRRYRFGMRCVYLGGGSLALKKAAERYDEKKHFTLPAKDEEACTFRRNESILTPEVLMLEGAARKEHDVMGFESSLEVVLRRTNGSLLDGLPDELPLRYPDLARRSMPLRTQRILMPPAVGIEDVARHGLFDGPDGLKTWQTGALPELNYRGGYPNCVDEQEPGLNDAPVTVRRGPAQFTSGNGIGVFQLRDGSGAIATADRFFPDPAARYLVLRIRRLGNETFEPLAESAIVPFFPPFFPATKAQGMLDTVSYRQVRPVVLTFETAGEAAKPGIRAIIGKPRECDMRVDGRTVTVSSVTIALAPHDDIELHAWCLPDLATLTQQFALPQYLADCRPERDGTCESAAARLEAHLRNTGPIEELAARQIIHAVHARNRPASNPTIAVPGGTASRLPSADGKSTDYWLEGALHLPLASCDAYEILARCASPHAATFDDASRGRSMAKRRATRWPTYRDSSGRDLHLNARDIFGFDVERNGKVLLPQAAVTLLRGDDLKAAPRNGPVAVLSLVDVYRAAGVTGLPGPKEPPVGKVALNHAFADTAARRMILRAVAKGRHAPLFSTRTTYGKEGGTRLLRTTVPLTARDQSRLSEEVEVWLPSTLRSAPPAALSCEPSFVVERRREGGKGVIEEQATRRCDVRVRLQRPWFSSGEGEMLAIVLACGDGSTEARILEEPDEKRTAMRAMFSRWGGDPVKRTDELDRELSGFQQFNFKDCVHRYHKIEKYALPLPDGNGKDARSQPLPVSLLCFEPHFDVDREEWFVDVPLRPRDTAEPFAHFVLVRYQEHTVAPIERTSLPTSLWAKLMPTRHVTTSCVPKGQDWQVTVVVTGASTDGPLEPSGQPTTSRPRMRLKVFHEADTAIGAEEDLVQSNVRQNLPRNDVRRQPVVDGDMTVGWTEQHENDCIWTLTAPVSHDTRRRLGPGKYVVYVTEVERYMPATYRDADTGMLVEPVDWATMKRADTLVEGGPLFAVRIELATPAGKLD